MQFDSHRGWYNPVPDFASRPYRADAPIYDRPRYTGKPETAPIETREYSVLLMQARSGDKAAEVELRFRGNRTSRGGL